MSLVAVNGSGARAAEWATRYLASGHDVHVDSAEVAAQVSALWPDAERLGVFRGAGLDRLKVSTTDSADFVQLVEGDAVATSAPLVATESTARGCSPIHVVPLVDVSGPDTDAL